MNQISFQFLLLLVIVVIFTPVSVRSSRSSCTGACQEAIESMRMEEIKTKLLRAMGMTKPLDLRNDTARLRSIEQSFKSVIDEFQAKYGLAETIDESEDDVTYIRAIDPSEGRSEERVAHFLHGLGKRVHKISKVTLKVYLDVPNHFTGTQSIVINVKERTYNGELGMTIATKIVRVSKSGHFDVDLSPLYLIRWEDAPILGLFVEAMLDEENIAIHPQQSEDGHTTMIMAISLGKQVSRQKRHDHACLTNGRKGCCNHDFVVDFRQIGWNFVLAPDRYNAGICRGNCTINAHRMNLLAHTALVTNQMLLDQTLHMTCCHANEYDSVKILFLNNERRITMARIPAMVVSRCTCS